MGSLLSAVAIAFFWQRPVEPKYRLEPSTPGPTTTNWTFSLIAENCFVSVDRESRDIVTTDSSGQVVTNSWSSGFTTTAVAHPGGHWNFGVFVPTNAIGVQVFIDADVAPRSIAVGASLIGGSLPGILGRLQERFAEAFVYPAWKGRVIASRKWIKHDGKWIAEPE